MKYCRHELSIGGGVRVSCHWWILVYVNRGGILEFCFVCFLRFLHPTSDEKTV